MPWTFERYLIAHKVPIRFTKHSIDGGSDAIIKLYNEFSVEYPKCYPLKREQLILSEGRKRSDDFDLSLTLRSQRI